MNLGDCPICDGNAWEVVDDAVVCADCYATINHPDVTEYVVV